MTGTESDVARTIEDFDGRIDGPDRVSRVSMRPFEAWTARRFDRWAEHRNPSTSIDRVSRLVMAEETAPPETEQRIDDMIHLQREADLGPWERPGPPIPPDTEWRND